MRKIFFRKITFLVVLCIVNALLSSCSYNGKIKYYSQKENYIDVTGVVTNISYNEDSSALYLSFSELSPALDDNSFKITGKNLQIVQANGIDTKIKIGDQITFITAPKYFGDGYVMPIAAIFANEECLLDFEEGYTNLLQWLSQ